MYRNREGERARDRILTLANRDSWNQRKMKVRIFNAIQEKRQLTTADRSRF